MDVIIRPMRKEDVEEVLEIEKLSFSTPWSKEAFISEVTKNSCAKYIVAEVDNKIVGYGGFWVVVDEGHITNIAVHPEYRFKGIGSKIMEGLIDLAKKKWNNCHDIRGERIKYNSATFVCKIWL